jgi:dolichol-phosphate mannosyltransferase
MTEPLGEPQVSIVLPTYNEVGNIVRLIDALAALVPEPKEFIVVDDGSTDGTAAAVDELSGRNPDVRLIVRKEERGLSSAIQTGIDASRGSVVVWMDADFSLPPETVPKLLAFLSQGYDAAVGSRFVPGGSEPLSLRSSALVLVQGLCTIALNAVTRWILRTPFHDWTSGFIAVRGPLIRGLRLIDGYGEYFIVLMAELVARKARWIEVPYANVPRVSGESKTADGVLGFTSRGVRYLAAVVTAFSILRREGKEAR